MYAIIETGGKQYKVESGDVLFIEKLDAAENFLCTIFCETTFLTA